MALFELVSSTHASGDYMPGGPVSGDNAAPAIAALMHGDLAGYAAHQPTMGATSLLLRAPILWLAHALHGNPMLGYQLGAFICLLPLGLFAGWLVARRSAPSIERFSGAIVAVLLVLGPVVQDAVSSGHPESVLKGVLSVAAVLAALAGRTRWAAVLLGLAVGTKPDALIAVPAVLVALPERRWESLGIAAAISAALVGLPPLANPGAFVSALHGESATHAVNDLSLWWPLGATVHFASGALAPGHLLPFGLSRSGASIIAVVVVAPILGWAYLRSRRRGLPTDALALLALLGLVRCLCDSTHLEYYWFTALMPLAAWEVISARRLPLLTAISSLAIDWLSDASPHFDPVAVNAISIGGMVLLTWYLSRAAFGSPAAPATDAQATAGRVSTV
ncbi:MAG TPA: glycosyltransferase 87 family protein [Solirubrobacteraceae bacterium]|nr:glycosyltransferase 87 family protein [Solirubrobacteraceae bacterium]